MTTTRDGEPMPKLIDLLTEGHELYFPPLVEAMEVNADFAAVIERAIGVEQVATDLLTAADDLQVAEADYRLAHDLHGDGSLVAGTMWDRMRKAGDQMRAALEKVKGGEE